MSTATISEQPAKPAVPTHHAKSILIQNQIEIPLGISSLAEFRTWTRSATFPEQGRIDYINGRIEVDLMIDNLFYHGSPKTEVQGVIWLRNRESRLGRQFNDVSRFSHPEAGLSAEPDVVFLTFDSINAGRATFIPSSKDDPESFVEIEGSPDLICEIVSDSSEQKDTVRLAQAYFAAGVTEYWLVDARGPSLDFSILKRDQAAFVSSDRDQEGYQPSTVFGHRYRFSREQGPDGHWLYMLDERPLT